MKVNSKLFSVLVIFLAVSVILSTTTLAAANETWLTQNEVYTNYIEPYVVPGGMSGLAGIVIGIVTIVILFSIFLDILTLVTPFSRWVTWVIAVGLGLVAIVIKLNITVAGWILSISAIVFSWAGAASVFLTVILAILVLIAIFFGGNKLTQWLQGIRQRRESFDRKAAARERGSQVDASVEQAAASIGEKARKTKKGR